MTIFRRKKVFLLIFGVEKAVFGKFFHCHFQIYGTFLCYIFAINILFI